MQRWPVRAWRQDRRFRHKEAHGQIEHQLDAAPRILRDRTHVQRACLPAYAAVRSRVDGRRDRTGRTHPYGAYRDNAQQVLDLIDKAQQRLNVAIDEESDSRICRPRRTVADRRHTGPCCRVVPIVTRARRRTAPECTRRVRCAERQVPEQIPHTATRHMHEKMRAEATLGPVRSKASDPVQRNATTN